mgnify:CR=1 FL=1
MVDRTTIKPLGFLVLLGLVGCAKVVTEPVVPVAPVKVVEAKIAIIEPKIVKTAAEIEAESYKLGEHWWSAKRSVDDNKSNISRDIWINKL